MLAILIQLKCIYVYIPHTYMCKSFSAVSVLGDFDIINFSDVTAESDRDNTAVFQFKFDPVTPHLKTSHRYVLHLTWSQVSGPGSGVIKLGNCNRYGRLERVDRHAGTYRLYVPLHLFKEGRLLVNISINISCSKNNYGNSRYECGCSEWQIRGMSNSLQISAKRG